MPIESRNNNNKAPDYHEKWALKEVWLGALKLKGIHCENENSMKEQK